ncbi:hypothetical protein [Sulfolobus acidocaldarius]|uniref:Uncharacterized protein n=2 Tax=Sulfolobus acidocaldarius TaxID=2285 RepID=M1J4E6_9CREN|nr:hypothetical protein [Sulfolobus acidocaldarius]AGE71829.1 hypothetical protein SacN8_09350 [Sulfolobus acidocaldarius N8]AGE74101.1 hypothetical protein SacRon12I_09370 [Sulfolobus acidocaldarius Ron12/I]
MLNAVVDLKEGLANFKRYINAEFIQGSIPEYLQAKLTVSRDLMVLT